MSEQIFGVEELFEQLKSDDSWESDPELRKIVVESLFASLIRTT